jgi:hypothetical protein
MPENKATVGKRTYKGGHAIRAFIFEKALQHDIRLAYEMCEKFFANDTRLTMDGDKVVVLAKEPQIKKGNTLDV